MNGIPQLRLLGPSFVPVIGSFMSPRNIDPAARTFMLTSPSTLSDSMCVVIFTQRPPLCLSGYTQQLVFTTPATFAITLDVPHGEPPRLW